MTYGPQVGDEVVRDLERLKPLAKSISMIKTQSTMYTNVNGQKEEHTNTKAQVAKDGELIARVAQNVDKTPNNPEPHVRTAVDIPSQNIHKVSEHGPKSDSASQQPPLPYNNYKKVSQYSPLDMAEYVFWTGDEKGVTTAIEEFLQEGLMSREEAIGYLQDIKQNLELLKDHYSEERYQRQLAAKERIQGGSDISEIRQQIRENLIKKSEIQDQQMSGLTEEDYEELVEKLKMADLMYNEYSLEEIIYQLAKLMFTQSLTRGSAEAQDALQKFTNFLEAEVQTGRISRSLEKKVLDVLIASLSDTLTDHPELINTARESLGLPTIPRDVLMRQLLYPEQKQDLNLGNNSPSMDAAHHQPHRFQSQSQSKTTLQNSGLQDQANKSN